MASVLRQVTDPDEAYALWEAGLAVTENNNVFGPRKSYRDWDFAKFTKWCTNVGSVYVLEEE